MGESRPRKPPTGPGGGAEPQRIPAPDAVLDGGDRRCVALLLELRSLAQRLPDGAVVHLVATDPAAPIDLPAWCHLTGHAYLGPVSPPASPPVAPPVVPPVAPPRPTYAVRVRATARHTEPGSPWRLT